MKGWGPKSSVCPSKRRETKLFGGIPRDFCRDMPGVPEKSEVSKRGWRNFLGSFWGDALLITVTRLIQIKFGNEQIPTVFV